MCGICGGAVDNELGDTLEAKVDAMIAHQHRRGPDRSGSRSLPWRAGGHVRLGHNRLRVIDITDASSQPMSDRSGRYWLTYNGELYNYLEVRDELISKGVRFRTTGDTEVLLESIAHWGLRTALDRFVGMFAFGLVDLEDQRLHLVRDRFGVKPLHYFTDRHQFLFASSALAVARQVGAPVDPYYSARGLNGLVFDDDTELSPYAGVRSIPPGSIVTVAQHESGFDVRCDSYYDLTCQVADCRATIADEADAQLFERLEALMHNAVEIRTRADVPFGVSLSGGLDSSVVTALVAANHARVLGITFGSLESPESEARLARQLAARADVELAFVDLTPMDFERALLETVRAQEAPFASGSVMAQNLVFDCGRRNGLTVMLGGQGGDEAFMGYRKYFMFAVSRALRRHRPVEAARAIGRMLPMLVAERHAMGDYWWNLRHRYRSGFEPLVLSLPPVGGISLGDDGTEADSHARQIKDIERSSLPTLLRYEDRNSMWSSIESRLPFMDHRLIELAIALPDRLKLRNGYGKWIVRELARDRVPDEIRTARYKRGFDVSFATWIEQGFGRVVREALLERADHTRHLIAPDRIATAFGDAELGRNPTRFAEASVLLHVAMTAEVA